MFKALFAWRAGRPAARPEAAPRFRPRLESLEGRLVPAPLQALVPAPAAAPALVQLAAAPAAASQPQMPTGPLYTVERITGGNEFVDSVYARPVGGRYRVSLTVAHGCCVEGGTLQQTLPAMGGSVFLVVSTRRLGPNWGDLGISHVVSWWNSKPTIKGLNYVRHMTVPLSFLNRLKKHDLICWVPPTTRDGQGQWKLYGELTELDKLLVSEYQRLPRLTTGNITAIGPATDAFNCYAYAANRNNPAGIGWVGPNAPPGVKTVPIGGDQDLFNFYASHGWRRQTVQDWSPPRPGEERVVLYATFRNGQAYFQHAALWTSQGVFAKMGRLGTFRFDNLQQMAGGYFGQPYLVLKRG